MLYKEVNNTLINVILIYINLYYYSTTAIIKNSTFPVKKSVILPYSLVLSKIYIVIALCMDNPQITRVINTSLNYCNFLETHLSHYLHRLWE